MARGAHADDDARGEVRFVPTPEFVFVDELEPGSWWVHLGVDGADRDAVLGRASELLTEARDAAASWMDLPQAPTAIPAPRAAVPPRAGPRAARGGGGGGTGSRAERCGPGEGF
jgi:hypothetical protein